ncbi:MAG: hypothetical protein CMC94_01025 [Flavobacteriales bacterium]|jgi:hypothetical protein|nr:hypothetical protein [Flavobacteriales bacterium]MDA8895324.1 porin family protein [Flavobacteriales bacterium]
MKKIILSLAAVLAFTLTTDAQTRKGTVLLGAGSQFSEQNINTLAITPKVGYFVQDGIAIGALVNFQTDNVDKSTYELNDQTAEIGVFGRYYVSNNLFTEVSLSSKNVSNEEFDAVTTDNVQLWTLGGVTVQPNTPGAVPQFDVNGDPVLATYDLEQVVETSTKTLNFNLGLGYTIVWREHFAVEPFMNLTFMNGESKKYDEVNKFIENNDLKGTNFNLGVNFSLFF